MSSMNEILASFWERDIRTLIGEINQFKSEENLWKIHGSIKNSAGNLALHIAGGSNFLIGTTLANTGYVRNRDLEFAQKGVPQKDLIAGLEALIPMIGQTVRSIDLEAAYPRMFDNKQVTNGYLLVILLTHLSYHTGQVNYLRRMIDS